MFNPIMQYKLSDTCDLQCAPCKLWQKTTEEEFPALAEVTLDLEALKKRGVRYINFTGCEPLLHPDVVEILIRAKKMGFKTIVTTHGGNYLSFRTGLKNYADLLVFLLHSHDLTIHDETAGVSSYDNVISAIDLAKEHKQKVMISFNVTRDNVQNVPEMQELATAKKVLLWLNPLPAAYGLDGFSADTIAYLKYYGRKPNVWLNLASIWHLTSKTGGLRERQDCIAVDEIITKSFSRIGASYFLNLFSLISLWWKLGKVR
ncbi:MAG: radical SAM protein [Candidatus Margulisbacteria bacterium]|nr:radical SAM protein [Candidatus Margulisiibacteriota bacterium]